MIKYKTNMIKYRLVKEKSDFPKYKITSSRDAFQVTRLFYRDDIEIYESFFLLLLNRSNNTIGYVKIGQGGITGTVADLTLIAQYAVTSLSSSVILVHNHPSGNIVPSNPDKSLTQKIIRGLKNFDIDVFDHIIISGNSDNYYSFADEGDILDLK